MNKKTKTNIQAILVILGIIILLISAFYIFGVKQEQLGQGNYIQVPFYGTIQCLAAEGYPITTPYYDVNTKHFVTPPVNSLSYNVLVNYPAATFGSRARVQYYTCDDTSFKNCATPSYKDITQNIGVATNGVQLITAVDGNKYLYVEFQKGCLSLSGWCTSSEGSVAVNYDPYVLWRQDSLQGGVTKCLVLTS